MSLQFFGHNDGSINSVLLPPQERELSLDITHPPEQAKNDPTRDDIDTPTEKTEQRTKSTNSLGDRFLYLLTTGSETALTIGLLLKIMFAFDVCGEDDDQDTCQDTLFYTILALIPFLGMIHTFFAERVLLSKHNIPDDPEFVINTLFDLLYALFNFVKNFAPVYAPVLGFAWAAIHELFEYFISRLDPDTPLAGNNLLLWGSLALAIFTSIPRAVFLYGELQQPQSEVESEQLACLPRAQEWIRNLPRPQNKREWLVVAAALLSASTEGALIVMEGLFDPLKTFGAAIGKTTELCVAVPAMLLNSGLELNTTLANLQYLKLFNTEKNYKSLIRLLFSASVNAIGPAAGMIEFALTLDEDASAEVKLMLFFITLLAAFQNERAILARMLGEHDGETRCNREGVELLEEGEHQSYKTFAS
jgi:hypothetical protein